ncbi:MAG: hypothetical protein LC753_07690 [Acidobacteria bacterium]|nr:hypothetical protein [Acidobacteriota bacterium]
MSDGERLIGYVCDGDVVSVWFEGTVDGDSIRLSSGRGDLLGEGTISDDASGEIEIQGENRAFNAPRVSGDAGLYRAVVGDASNERIVEGGWIVLPNGSQRGAITMEGGGDVTEILTAPPIYPPVQGGVDLGRFGRVRVGKVTDVDASILGG